MHTQIQDEPQIAPQIYHLAATHQLGQPTAEYRTRVTLKLLVALFCLAFAVIVLILALIVFIFSLHIPAPYTYLHLLVIGVAFLFYGLYLSFKVIPVRNTHLYICAYGFLWVKEEKVRAIRWDQIEGVWHKEERYGYIYDIHTYTVRLVGGKTLKFNNNWHNILDLGHVLMNETSRYLFPQAMAVYNTGMPVVFGDLKLSLQGISGRKRNLAWSQIKNIDVGQTAVTIEATDDTTKPWAIFRIAGIPNLLVFEKLLDYTRNGLR